MNKKFSTLMVSLLLASAFVGTASAVDFETVADGKYYKLIRFSQIQTTGSWSTNDLSTAPYYLSQTNGVMSVKLTADTDAEYWKISKMTVGGATLYSFTNKLGEKLTYGNDKQEWFSSSQVVTGGNSISPASNVHPYMDYVSYSETDVKFATWPEAATSGTRFYLAFDAVACGDEEMTVDELNAKGTGSAFQLSVKKDAKLEKDLTVESNPLTTKTIVAVKGADNKIYFKVSGDFKNGDATTTDAFKKSEFIVADTIAYSNLNTSTVIGTDGKGYQYIVVKGSTMVGTPTRSLENAQFVVTKNANDEHVKIKNPDAKFPSANSTGLSSHTAPTNDPYTTVYNFNGKNYIGTGDAANTYLTFGAGSSADLTALAGQIVKVDYVGTGGNGNIGTVLATKADGSVIGWVKAAYVDQTKPEGRFYVKVNDSKNLEFVNLENGKTYAFNGTIYDKGDNVYANGTDTLKLTAVTRAAQTEGYLNFDKDALADKVFTASLFTKALGNGYWVAPVQSTGVVTFSSAAADATEWSLVKAQKASSDDYAKSDSIIVKLDYNVWNAKDKKYEAASDSTVSFAYAIKESVSGNYLVWDAAKNAYKLSKTAEYFVFKEKDGHVVIIPETIGGTNAAAWNTGSAKLIGAASSNNLAQVKTIYSVVENDLFDITEINAMRYSNLGELALDTVKVFRADNEKVVLFEKNESTVIKDSINFLGIEHIADVENMKVAMFVDTAYVSNTVVPKYMFVVGSPVITYKKEQCSDPTHESHLTDKIVSITGRYLVNLADSAAEYADYRNNPYVHKYEGANCPRLGFVDATHADNKLTIANTKKEIDLSKDAFQYCTFALRYVDREEGSFKLQTKGGYVKYMNGVVAVTSEANADVFNLTKTSEEPTANEVIAAEGVQVIAGKGTVTVQGAAGKVITVANILGQTIANQVATSDNVTIAAPAGVVVVAVEGEATKVVVK